MVSVIRLAFGSFCSHIMVFAYMYLVSFYFVTGILGTIWAQNIQNQCNVKYTNKQESPYLQRIMPNKTFDSITSNSIFFTMYFNRFCESESAAGNHHTSLPYPLYQASAISARYFPGFDCKYFSIQPYIPAVLPQQTLFLLRPQQS